MPRLLGDVFQLTLLDLHRMARSAGAAPNQSAGVSGKGYREGPFADAARREQHLGGYGGK